MAADDEDAPPPEAFYNKSKSFFDSISCEALERSKGNMNKPDWRAEKKLNKQTFGVTGGGGGGGFRRGGYGFRGGNRGGGWGRGGNRGGYGYRGGENKTSLSKCVYYISISNIRLRRRRRRIQQLQQ